MLPAPYLPLSVFVVMNLVTKDAGPQDRRFCAAFPPRCHVCLTPCNLSGKMRDEMIVWCPTCRKDIARAWRTEGEE